MKTCPVIAITLQLTSMLIAEFIYIQLTINLEIFICGCLCTVVVVISNFSLNCFELLKMHVLKKVKLTAVLILFSRLRLFKIQTLI